MKIEVFMDKDGDKSYLYYDGQNGNCGDLQYKLCRNGCLKISWLTLSQDGYSLETQIFAPGTWHTIDIIEPQPTDSE